LVKHIIWDFDGTLFNTYPEISKVFQKVLQEYNVEEKTSDILKNLHFSLWHAYSVYSKKHNLDLTQLQKTFSNLDEQMNPGTLKPFDNVIDIINSIKGNNYIFTHRGISTYKYLNYYDYTKYFMEIITREDGFKRKPNPQAINYLLKKYNLEKEKTIYIGDRLIDVQCAKNAGVQSCYFNSHNIEIDEQANYTINSYINFKF